MDLSRRNLALLTGIGTAAVLASQKAQADTVFTSFSYPATNQSGGGTTPSSQTTPQRTGEGWANVKDFGAKGDGSTIDTTAIQAAINWTATNAPVGTVFFPYGTYIVDAPLTFNSDITVSICFLGVGVGSTIQTINTGLPGDAVLSRGTGATGATNDTSIITIEKLEIVNYGALGCAIKLAASSLGASIRDCFIHADIGISCGEFVNPIVATNAPTSSGTTLHFAAVPQAILVAFNTGQGSAVTVADLTNPGSITGGTNIAGATSTTITLSAPVAGTVSSADNIQFTYTQQIAVQGAWQVVAERVHCEAHHDYIPGSFGIALIENSLILSCDMDTYDHAVRITGDGNVVIAPHIETCRKAIVLGVMPNGVAQGGSNFGIIGFGGESNGVGIDCVSSFGIGEISGSGEQVSAFAVPYTGSVPVSGVSVTGSNSGATGTAAVAYNTSHSQYEITLTSVSGTFQIGDSIGDGTNIPRLTAIGSFVSGSGGSGTVCAGLSGQGEYGLHGATLLGNVVISASGFQGVFNQAAIDCESGDGAANVTFISCEARNDIAGRPAWVTPSIAGDAKYINCNLDQPKYAFNNLRPYPFVQFGDEFFVTNSSVSTFGGTVDGAGSTPVRALASTVVTGNTNNTTAIGNNTLHFASTPAGIVNGMVVGDSTLRIGSGVQPFPVGTIVQSQTGSTVVLSANATTQVGSGDLIGFVLWTVSGA